MANFCTNCGNPLEPTWEFCPYCQYHLYHKPSSDVYQPLDNQSELFYTSNIEREGKKTLTKRQKRAILIAVIVVISATIIPIGSIFIYRYFFPEKTVQFYVNNGSYLTSYTFSTTRATLTYFESQPHPSHTHWDADYVAQVIESYCTPNDETIIQIAQAIQSKCNDQNNSEEIVNALLSYTQAIGYKTELIDIAQYSLETIFNQGDCEDLSILFGSLVVSLGYEAIICIINYYDVGEGEWFGHACVGVYLNFTPTQHASYPPSHSFTVDSKEYWICETTYQGWMIGELPTYNPIHYSMEAYEFIN